MHGHSTECELMRDYALGVSWCVVLLLSVAMVPSVSRCAAMVPSVSLCAAMVPSVSRCAAMVPSVSPCVAMALMILSALARCAGVFN